MERMERRASIIREGNGHVGPRLLEVVFFFLQRWGFWHHDAAESLIGGRLTCEMCPKVLSSRTKPTAQGAIPRADSNNAPQEHWGSVTKCQHYWVT